MADAPAGEGVQLLYLLLAILLPPLFGQDVYSRRYIAKLLYLESLKKLEILIVVQSFSLIARYVKP